MIEINGTPMPIDPGCFWHGEEPITETTYLICGECGHVFATREDLEREVRRSHAETDAYFMKTGYTWSPLPEVIDVDAWPYCPFCAHDL